MREVKIEQVNDYNKIVEATIGTEAYDMVALYREYRDDDTKRWGGNPYNYLYPITTYDWFKDQDSIRFYLRTINGRSYIYTYLDGEPADRHLLEGNEFAKALFGV